MNTSRKSYRSLVDELDLLLQQRRELNRQIEAFCAEMKDAADWARNFRRYRFGTKTTQQGVQ
jgi:hypothetical protein